LADDAKKLVRRLRRVTKLPIAVGFGISNAEQFAEVGEFADAVVVGSAIVETIERNVGREAAAVAEFVGKLTGETSSAGVDGRNSHVSQKKRDMRHPV
jgi:tryptophan synthase alpha chain